MKLTNKIPLLFFLFCLLEWQCSRINAESVSILTNSSANSSDTLTRKEFEKWYSDNISHLSVKREMNNIDYKLEYIPSELMRAKLNCAEGAYDKFLLFTLKIEVENKIDILEYPTPQFTTLDQKVHYFSFDMQRLITLNINGIGYPCVIYNYEKNYGIKPFTEILIGFDKPNIKTENYVIKLNDQYFGSGEINFSMESTLINNTPMLTNKL